MDVSSFFPMWNQLAEEERRRLKANAFERTVPRGALLSAGSKDCTGLIAVQSGQLRIYILSDEGREITLYRLLERDICLFSASCLMKSIQFDITVEAEKDSRLWIIDPEAYRQVMDQSAPLANYTNQLMADRFTDVMWLMEQILWKSQDRRLAAFLLEESMLNDSRLICLTHEKIAAHLGTAREVVTRMLRYLQGEGMVKLKRGAVEITDENALRRLADG